MNEHKIGINVRKIRKKLDKTQAQVAEKASITSMHLSHIERGGTIMSIDCLLNLCAAMSVTPNDILEGEFKLTSKAAYDMLLGIMAELTEDENMLILEIADSMRKLKVNRK